MASYPYKRPDGSWGVAFTNAQGRLERRACTALSKKEARKLAERLEAEAAEVRKNSTTESRDWTVADLMDWWLKETSTAPAAAQNASSVRKHIASHDLGGVLLARLRPADVENFLAEKKKELSLQSVRHLRGYLSRAFNLASERGKWAAPNPVAKVKRVKVPTSTVADYLRPREVAPVLAAIPETWRPLYATALFTAARRGELAALRREDVLLDAGVILIRRSWKRDTTKGGKPRPVAIHPELRSYLETALEAAEGDLVFPNLTRDTDLPGMLRRALADAGVVQGFEHRCRCWHCGHRERAKDKEPRFCAEHGKRLYPKPIVRMLRFHDLRVTWASLSVQSGVDVVAVQRTLGHRDLKTTTDTYGHFAPNFMAQEIAKLSLLTQRDAATLDRYTPATDSAPEQTKAPETVVVAGASNARDTGFEPVAFGSGGGA
jgi:integrase